MRWRNQKNLTRNIKIYAKCSGKKSQSGQHKKINDLLLVALRFRWENSLWFQVPQRRREHFWEPHFIFNCGDGKWLTNKDFEVFHISTKSCRWKSRVGRFTEPPTMSLAKFCEEFRCSLSSYGFYFIIFFAASTSNKCDCLAKLFSI